MEDKEILYQMIERYIDNLVLNMNPMFSLLAQPAKKWILQFIDPYVDAFFSGEPKVFNSKAAAGFLKEEMNTKIEEFLNKFEEEKGK